MFSNTKLFGAHLIILIMTEECAFMLTTGKIIEENPTKLKSIMNQKAVRAGIQILS